MRQLYLKILSIFTLIIGTLLVLLGVVGLLLLIIPGLVLILIGGWMINKVYNSPLLMKILEFTKCKKDDLNKEHSKKRTNELQTQSKMEETRLDKFFGIFKK